MFDNSALPFLKVSNFICGAILLWKSVYRKFSTGADIFSYKMIIVTDITILFSDLVSLIVPLQTWNVKYYKYAIIKNSLKSLIISHASRFYLYDIISRSRNRLLSPSKVTFTPC